MYRVTEKMNIGRGGQKTFKPYVDLALPFILDLFGGDCGATRHLGSSGEMCDSAGVAEFPYVQKKTDKVAS